MKEGLQVSKFGICYFFKKYRATDSITRKPGSGYMSKLMLQVLQLIDEQMERDDETTAVELQAMLKKEVYDASLTSIQ